MASTLFVARELQAVTSPFPEACFTIGSIKKQAKGSSGSDSDKNNAELIRKQRLMLERAIRRSKRDAELEKRRHVLEKLNWVVWDESDDEDRDIPVETASDLIGQEISRINELYSTNIAAFESTIRNDPDLVANTVQIISGSDMQLMTDATKLLLNITSSEPEFMALFIEGGGLEILPGLLNNMDHRVQTSSIRILSNLTSCSTFANDIAASEPILLALIDCLYFGSRETQTFATEASLNLIRYSANQARLLKFVEYGLLDALADMFRRPDAESVYMVLSLLKDLFEKAKKHGSIKTVISAAIQTGSHVERIFNNPNQPRIVADLAELLLVHYYDKYQPDESMID